MRTLIIFAKAPIPGLVKTRLARGTPLDEARVCYLYEAFLQDTITIATLTGAENIALHFTPPEEEKTMRKLVKNLRLGARNEGRFTFRAQIGENFTERVANSFEMEAESGGEELVMIGADSPILKPQIIDAAFDFIFSRSGMAVGPSGEGGAYLIGFPAGANIDFDGVFTQGSELENLLDRARAGNIPFRLLPEILDVDVESDLITLIGVTRALAYERKFDSQIFPKHTYNAIEELGLKVERAVDDTRSKRIIVS